MPIAGRQSAGSGDGGGDGGGGGGGGSGRGATAQDPAQLKPKTSMRILPPQVSVWLARQATSQPEVTAAPQTFPGKAVSEPQ